MKYGVLFNRRTENIGDDIQSYAQMRFLPQIDYVIDRERLDTFSCEEKVAVIMNAWYMYNKSNWPPSASIYPLLLSMHIAEDDYFGIGTKFLDGLGGDYLRNHGPVGARDESTLNLLQKKEIESYWSGCMTLTIEQFPNISKDGNVCFVDLDEEISNFLEKEYSDISIVYLSHIVEYINDEKTFEDRIERVKKLLKRYQAASYVVTSRLHCALPCLALGTPVVLVYKEEYDSRMSSFLPILNVTTRDDILNGKFRFDFLNPPQNKDEYKKIRANLENRCRHFIDDLKGQSISVSNEDNRKVTLWQKNLLYTSEYKFRSKLNEQQRWIEELEAGKTWLEHELQRYIQTEEEKNKYIQELLEGKDWIENQWSIVKAEVERQKEYIDKIEEEKRHLEKQCSFLSRDS